ncbi:GEM-like protein 4 isoform X1 [Cucurbita pepo subsp. pepo]|uniref:GEM-like protein 4 isoform X1 n=1 Tax=Cucurbita pepo subsp. pepo TaxID=3664 RepID=UPI000C9D7E67|nr:GEM-like protein 4 isoform X1 [Cucurbita pepo subsp. pepo]
MNSFEKTPERRLPLYSDGSPSSYGKDHSKLGHKKQLIRKRGGFVFRVYEHVKLGPKFSVTARGKLRLGAKIIRQGGRKNIFKHAFGIVEGEELLKASQCYLSTSAGPIAGLLFMSTHRVAFCSEQSITFPSPTGELIKTQYKVMIPLKKVIKANQSENVSEPDMKYIEVVTDDNFDFWFMGFLRYEKAFKTLRKAISMAHRC